MPCEAPRNVHRPTNGGPLSFTGPRKDGQSYTAMQLPCGTCLLCQEEKARQQAVRIYHESMSYMESSFITLSYAPKHEPQYGSLHYEHLVKFWKRMRKHLWQKQRKRLRYYAVGEYGDKSLRPHYHACVFGHAFTDNRIILKTTPHLLWTCPLLEEWWGLGYVSVGALNFRTARYTASYVTKKLRSKQQYVRTDETTGELIPLEQPRSFMSRNLGKKWWEENRHFVSAHDYVVIDGRKQKPPRAYDKWLASINKLPMELIKEQRQLNSTKLSQGAINARASDVRAKKQLKSTAI